MRPAATVIGRFSTLESVCVPIVVLTGIGQSWRLLESFEAITATPFGRMLVTKVVVATLLVALGAMARYTLRRHGAGSLRRTVAAMSSGCSRMTGTSAVSSTNATRSLSAY